MELGAIGCNAWYDGTIAFKEALIVDGFAVSIAVELVGEREAVVGYFFVLVTEHVR
jgi:hypothetical protein